ncbi:MAG: SMC family ATPase [Clostridia bacterium]|nr:SMC family ATPase [Clostridia bacterium]
MKPLYLEIQAFGPFVEKQIIDFEKLGENGIFLIKGNTGSGKTTIFDAMTYALYGGGTGDSDTKRPAGRNNFEEWRCTQAGADLDTIVSFTFSVHGHRYVFTRKLIQKRVKLDPKLEAGEIDEDGNVIPFFENPKKDDLDRKAAELIGLTKDQFRQVVLLPQGQFERFLTADSGEKEDILKKIFGAEQWEKYAQAFYDAANSRRQVLLDIRRDVEQALAQEGLSDLAALSEQILSLQEEQKEREQKHTAFRGDKKREELDRDRKLAEQFEILRGLEKEKAVLDGKRPEIDRTERTLELSGKAEQVREPLSDYEKADADFSEKQRELKLLENRIPAAEEEEKRAEKEKSEHEANSPVESLNEMIGRYKSRREIYQSIGERRKQYKAAEDELSALFDKLDRAEVLLTAKKESEARENEKYEAAREKADRYHKLYIEGIYGEIASELKDNEKCPVCGSTHHPEPAEKLTESVSRVELEIKDKEADDSRKQWKKADDQRRAAELDRDKIRSAFEEKKNAFAMLEAAYQADAGNLIEGIPDLKALDREIAKAGRTISDYQEKSVKLQKALTDAQNTLAGLRGQIENAKTSAVSAEELLGIRKNALRVQMLNCGFEDIPTVKENLLSDDERMRYQQKIAEYHTRLQGKTEEIDQKQSELAGVTEPDAEKFPERLKEIDDENRQYIKDSERQKTTAERLVNLLTDLDKKQKHVDTCMKQADNDLAFARKLRGDTGIGLQRYVLAIMFNQVIGEANRMLSKVHGGRYHLFRTDDKGSGNKRGLELKVHDSRSPEREGRSIAMLSGGEKFLVSLALSIGMSTVAQRSGVQIEALFIDEGFGTLDESSIRDAMDVLDSVRRGTGTIGIISHVQLLEANIPTHLHVIKRESGSILAVE